MTNPFGSVPVPKKGSTLFDESHSLSGNFPFSVLAPVFLAETIPGDRWDINVFNLTKLETLIAPAMQPIDASLLWFKIPKRLVFKHFKKWYSGGPDGKDEHEKPHIFLWQFAADLLDWLANTKSLNSTQIAYVTNELFGSGSLWQYMGLPVPLTYDSATGVWSVLSLEAWRGDNDHLDVDSGYIDMMYHMAYHMLYDEYFRDQTLSDGCFEDAEEGIFKVNNKYNNLLRISDTNVILLPNTTGTD